jgi:hypothetical protein
MEADFNRLEHYSRIGTIATTRAALVIALVFLRLMERLVVAYEKKAYRLC